MQSVVRAATIYLADDSASGAGALYQGAEDRIPPDDVVEVEARTALAELRALVAADGFEALD